jgi:methylglyoxal synthase
VTCLRSGPLGGDRQIGARIAEGERADYLISSPLLGREHDRKRPDFSGHTGGDRPDLALLTG